MTVSKIRTTEEAYRKAKEKANERGMTICKWVSKAILEQALMEEMLEEEINE